MNKLFQHKWFPVVIQLLMLVAFFLLVLGGLLANTNDNGIVFNQ